MAMVHSISCYCQECCLRRQGVPTIGPPEPNQTYFHSQGMPQPYNPYQPPMSIPPSITHHPHPHPPHHHHHHHPPHHNDSYAPSAPPYPQGDPSNAYYPGSTGYTPASSTAYTPASSGMYPQYPSVNPSSTAYYPASGGNPTYPPYR